MRSTHAELMHGLAYKNAIIKQINLRELRGIDEEALANAGQVPLFMTAIDLLSRVTSADKLRPQQLVRLLNEMSIGDRNRLMLELYRLSIDKVLDLVVVCPLCSAEMSLEVQVENLLRNSESRIKDETLRVGQHVLKLRPLTGADQMRYLEMEDSKRGKQEFLKLCIVSSLPPLPAQALADDVVAADKCQTR